MTRNIKFSDVLIFMLEILLVIWIPLVVCWSSTPTNVLNSNYWYKLLESFGIFGSELIFFTGIPLGVIGIVKARKRNKLHIPMLVISILNLLAGVFELVVLIIVFCAVVFGGVTH